MRLPPSFTSPNAMLNPWDAHVRPALVTSPAAASLSPASLAPTTLVSPSLDSAADAASSHRCA
ncbi:hypothetical protein WOLCODRAFT_151679 [Wolfiporia cocos MD-104 SS10]|uniref:Uncharacterized protein n=1 Tax=Wolfiporia cocos (strain MD-104) TaxID=742152 RepID=A0A2H3JUV8_WOLCO|nr:hypothetical protein WOLCODRAFT_151679 [Wolfiporia cocos MD-104 SS10]